MASRRPKVGFGPADKFAHRAERIIEYSYPAGTSKVAGGLISVAWVDPSGEPDDAFLRVSLYRHEDTEIAVEGQRTTAVTVHGHLDERQFRHVGLLLGARLGRHKPDSTEYVFEPMNEGVAVRLCRWLRKSGISHDREISMQWRPER